MKFVKITAIACCAAMLAAAFTGCADKNNKDKGEDEMTAVTANSENVKLLGRTTLIDDTLWLALSGSGIEFEYTGNDLNLTFEGDGASQLANNESNYARIAVFVDGERVTDTQINSKTVTVNPIKSNEVKTYDVKVIKLSECAMSTVGIKPIELADGEKIEPVAENELKIEFIGDSITCGYGVDDEDENHHFSTATEDVTKAYAYKTAEALGADYSMFSISGYGIISGYTDSDTKVESQTIPQYYDTLGYSWNSFASSVQPQSVQWNFSSFQPDIVVINLGTNDDSYCQSYGDRQDEFSASYVEFLKQVREKNPNAKIVCTVGIMGQRIYTAIQTAVYNYTKETNDENISTFEFDQQNQSEDGLAADWHPTEATHEKAAAKLVEYLKSLSE